MFKDLFNVTISLIFKPSSAWNELSKKEADNNEKFLSDYIYPFVGIITLAAFLGALFTRKEFDIQIALKSSILTLLSVLGGFFLASYIVNEMQCRMFNSERNLKKCQRFVGYSSALTFSIHILLSLLPEFFFIRFFILYTIYIVWEGAIPYMQIDESNQLKFVSLSTAIIILTPIILEFVLSFIMPGLRL